MFFGKNKISTSPRASVGNENGQINSSANKTLNLITLDETKRASQQPPDPFLAPPHYGKTLNVPDSNVLQVLPSVTPAAPITPPRPAIMTTPRIAQMKSLSNETKPGLLVTTTNNQQPPQTVTVPNGRRLPLNGRIATMTATKPRQQPIANNNHQMVNETTSTKPRPAVYIPGKRRKIRLIDYSGLIFR